MIDDTPTEQEMRDLLAKQNTEDAPDPEGADQ